MYELFLLYASSKDSFKYPSGWRNPLYAMVMIFKLNDTIKYQLPPFKMQYILGCSEKNG